MAGKAKALFPEDFPALERFAHTLHRGGKRRAAEEAYKLLINRFPDKTHGWIGLTNLLLSQDKPDEAESVALRAKVLFPDDFPTLERCAHLRHRKGMYRDAEVAYRTLSERYPEKVQAWTGLTNALLVQNKLEEAESVARNAAALFPNEFSALERHAHCCLRNNKFNDSNRTYRSIDRLLTLPAQYHDFASALEHLGEHEEAKRIYKLALNKLGNHPILINGFSNFLSRSGDNQSLMDFIDATYFCSSKKTALIIGNCQSIAMSSILELHEEFTSEYSIINSIPPIHEMSIELQHFVSDMLLPRIDLLVTQDLLNLHCPLKTNVAKGIAQSTIVFPTFHFTGYFPDMVTLKTDDATPRNAPLTNYHSALIVTSYFDGVTPEDCAKRLTSGDWIERGYRTYLSSLFEELYHRERHWDVKFTDNLYKSYKSGILFHTFNHPNACLLHDAANSLLGILGMGRLPQHIVNATSDRLNYIQWLVNEKIRNELSLVQNGSACFSIYSAKISAVDFVRSHYQHYETNSLIVEKCIDICRKAIFSWQE
ncbi:hypothetical protein NNJEOMEG_03573 [Fundidesulfovibrio magnetotacticus]|uniref:Polysaccharide biosynthesis enzyme WcbI domain-containing protein n=1 Tax=Fundidesulfovibrio magnetotacticus TaxID=2730080 RepID=A0A6V8M595_9BACT|nr:hypothetical protein NNJEOMEG_03573 [Fundidesulfovibrio magnetotacticus]